MTVHFVAFLLTADGCQGKMDTSQKDMESLITCFNTSIEAVLNKMDDVFLQQGMNAAIINHPFLSLNG